MMGTVAGRGPSCQIEGSCAGAKLAVRTLPHTSYQTARTFETAEDRSEVMADDTENESNSDNGGHRTLQHQSKCTRHNTSLRRDHLKTYSPTGRHTTNAHIPVSTPLPINAKTPPKRHNATFLLVRRPSPVQHIVNRLSRIPLGLDEQTPIPRCDDAGCVLLREAGIHDGRLVAQLGADVRGDAVDGADDDEAGEDGFGEAAVGGVSEWSQREFGSLRGTYAMAEVDVG